MRDRDVTTSTPFGEILYIYHFPTLDPNCYGPVTAIEYCYSYISFAGSGQVTFNWTVLILQDVGSNFVINNIYAIQSHPSMGSANCTSSGDFQDICCDVTNIEGLDLPMNFIFEVTESAQGNTHNAALLGFSHAMPQYQVNATTMSKDGLTLFVGFPIPNDSPAFPRGLHMLWFVIGKHQTNALYSPPFITQIFLRCAIN